MNEFREAIKREQSRIEKLIALTDHVVRLEKRGALIADRRSSGIYCYERKGRSKKYLGKSDSDAARACAEYHFLTEKSNRLKRDRRLLEKLSQDYAEYNHEAVIAALPNAYRTVLCEDFNNERYEELKQWANEEYLKNDAPFPHSEIYLKDGRRVRSKGECLHGNILIDMGIPFRYDSIITVTDQNGHSRRLSPDFLIQCFDGSLVILEHLARLFDKRYALDFGEKSYWYLQAGFILGRNCFVTSDDLYGGTDSQAVWETAKAIERLFYKGEQ